MTTRQEFVDDIMLDTLEASLSLWEVAGLAMNAFADLPTVKSRNIARDVVRDLLARGWVELRGLATEDLERTPSAEPEPVDAGRIHEALQDEKQWTREAVGDAPIRFFIHATPKGDRELHESLRERGLYRGQ